MRHNRTIVDYTDLAPKGSPSARSARDGLSSTTKGMTLRFSSKAPAVKPYSKSPAAKPTTKAKQRAPANTAPPSSTKRKAPSKAPVHHKRKALPKLTKRQQEARKVMCEQAWQVIVVSITLPALAAIRSLSKSLQVLVDTRLTHHVVLDGQDLWTHGLKIPVFKLNPLLERTKVLDLVRGKDFTGPSRQVVRDVQLENAPSFSGVKMVRVLNDATGHPPHPQFSSALATLLNRLKEPCVVNLIDATPRYRAYWNSSPTCRGVDLDCKAPVLFNILFTPSHRLFGRAELQLDFSKTSANVVLFTPTAAQVPRVPQTASYERPRLLFSLLESIFATSSPAKPITVTLVGVERWPHQWLSPTNSFIVRSASRGSTIHSLFEPSPLNPELKTRLWWWMGAMAASSGYTEWDTARVLSGVKMVTLEEFKFHVVGDAEELSKILYL